MAGDTFLLEIVASNSDGIYSGNLAAWPMYWKSNQQSSDTNMARGYPQLLITDLGQITLDTTAEQALSTVTLGVAYTRAVLYNSEGPKAVITLTDTNGVSASTWTITVLHSTINTLEVEDSLGIITAPVCTLGNDGNHGAMYYSKGYDLFGNPTGHIGTTSWSTAGTIPPVKETQASATMIYSPVESPGSEYGYLIATDPNSLKKDSIYIYIRDYLAALMTTVNSYDTNGNGYLDKLEIFYSENIKMNDTAGMAAAFSFTGAGDLGGWTIADINPKDTSTNTLTLTLVEHAQNLTVQYTPNEILETSLRPTIGFNGWAQIEGATIPDQRTATDKAGPVLRYATIYDRSTLDPSDDVVSLVWSEPIIHPGAKTADLMFNVWYPDIATPATVPPEPPFFCCDVTFLGDQNDSATVSMLNGNKITSLHWISVNQAGSNVFDKNQNPVNAANRKIRPNFNETTFQADMYPVPGSYNKIVSGLESISLRYIVFHNYKIHANIYDLAGNLVCKVPAEMYRSTDAATGVHGQTYTKLIPPKNIQGKWFSRGAYVVKIFGQRTGADGTTAEGKPETVFLKYLIQ
jgi:hypothetical protein